MSKTVIKRCACKNAYQDARYGAYMRVHNLNKNDEGSCTVCKQAARARRWNFATIYKG